MHPLRRGTERHQETGSHTSDTCQPAENAAAVLSAPRPANCRDVALDPRRSDRHGDTGSDQNSLIPASIIRDLSLPRSAPCILSADGRCRQGIARQSRGVPRCRHIQTIIRKADNRQTDPYRPRHRVIARRPIRTSVWCKSGERTLMIEIAHWRLEVHVPCRCRSVRTARLRPGRCDWHQTATLSLARLPGRANVPEPPCCAAGPAWCSLPSSVVPAMTPPILGLSARISVKVERRLERAEITSRTRQRRGNG